LIFVRAKTYVPGTGQNRFMVDGWGRSMGRKIVATLGAIFLPGAPAQAEWIAAMYTGGAHTYQSTLALQIPELAASLTLHPVSYAAEPFQSPIYYGYRAGYCFSRHFGFEGEFTHLKVYAETNRSGQVSGLLRGASVDEVVPLNAVVQRFNITHGLNLLTGNFVVRKAFRQNEGVRDIYSVGADWRRHYNSSSGE
jgi:hypothetical protein